MTHVNLDMVRVLYFSFFFFPFFSHVFLFYLELICVGVPRGSRLTLPRFTLPHFNLGNQFIPINRFIYSIDLQ
jgi:hypothetical protein